MPRLSYSKRNAIRQALEIQGFCRSALQLLDRDLREESNKELHARISTALGHLAKTWGALQETVRILKGDPMPGSLRPERPKKFRRTEPTDPMEWIEPSKPDSQ